MQGDGRRWKACVSSKYAIRCASRDVFFYVKRGKS